MKLKRESILKTCVVLLVAVGVCWTAFNIMRAAEFKAKIRGKLDTISNLQKLKQQNNRIEAAFVLLAAVSNNPATLSVLVSAAVPGQIPAIRELESKPLKHDLKAKKFEVVFTEIRLDLISSFLKAAETQCPPWRLVECVITASQKADGFGTATLIMETVSR
jgi:hypothetical protein